MKELSTQLKDYKPAPYNKPSTAPMLYRVDIMGWDKENALIVSESEREAIENSLSTGSFVKIGDNLINPNMIRFITATQKDTREKYEYKKIEQPDGSVKVVRLEIKS